MTTRLVVATLVALASPAAADAFEPGREVKLLGWTSDGTQLVWTTVETAESQPKSYVIEKNGEQVPVDDPDKLPPAERAKVQEMEIGMAPPQTDETATIAVVYDVRTAVQARYRLAYKAVSKLGKKHPTLAGQIASLPDAAAFTAWKKLHALTKTPAKSGPAGAVAVKVDLTASEGEPVDPPTTSGATTRWSVANAAKVTMTTTCGAEHASEVIDQQMGAMYVPQWSATSYWSPAGRHVLVELVEGMAKTMRGPDGGHLQYVVLPCGVRVEVDAPQGLEAAALPVVDAIDKAGLAVVKLGKAKAHRAATVIYADDAHTAAATKLATKIPGGATVDKLTWKPKADLVVAIGDSAK